MYTRGPITEHPYQAEVRPRFVRDGIVKLTTHKGIQQTWAIARPVYSHDPSGAPFYFSTVNNRPSGALVTQGVGKLTPPRPKIEMDPSDESTWQRRYRFSS